MTHLAENLLFEEVIVHNKSLLYIIEHPIRFEDIVAFVPLHKKVPDRTVDFMVESWK